jgi:hypothetical protein
VCSQARLYIILLIVYDWESSVQPTDAALELTAVWVDDICTNVFTGNSNKVWVSVL